MINSDIKCLVWCKPNMSFTFSELSFWCVRICVQGGCTAGSQILQQNSKIIFCRALIQTYSRAMVPILLITTPHGKVQRRLQWKEKVVSEKINLFSWHLAAQSVLSHVEGNCNCHNMLTLGTYFYALPGGLESFEVRQFSLTE